MTAARDPQSVVERQLDAYNAHDLDAFLATYAPEVVVHRRDGSVREGAEALGDTYRDQFAAGRCRAEISGRLVEGEWVVDHETAYGITEEPIRLLVAYRVRDGLIDQVRFLA
ncbi:nuclear transport factor 2 family protein [Kitasatospora sp. NPDC101801]|uniref:nuclear transport factor 2 family protein n=1 Tax=Kitasatospora sp. NPDC101801 TaxID=3364103 RepID=UPI003805C2E6